MTINPWDVREFEEAEKDPNTIYLSVGKALSAWERVEQQLSYLFAYFCVGTGSGEESFPAKRAFGSVVTFRGRTDMLHAAAEAYFIPFPNHEMNRRFFDLLNLARKFSPRRNEIAHGYVTSVYLQMDESQNIRKMNLADSLRAMRWLLCPPEYATNKNTPALVNGERLMRWKYAYSAREIDYYKQQFDELRGAIWQLVLDWADKYPEADILPPS